MRAPFKVVIPARLSSERLPNKPLVDVAGKPLVVRVLERAFEAGAEEVVVAVDDPRIAEIVQSAGGEAQMTSPEHPSGTDRLAEVARAREWPSETIVVNLQGDEPLVPPRLLARLATALIDRPQAGIATAAVPILDAEELFRPSAVKVVLDDDGYALYFSRAPIPWVRDAFPRMAPVPLAGGAGGGTSPSATAVAEGPAVQAATAPLPGPQPQAGGEDALPAGVPFLRHLGLYAYRVATLRHLTGAPRSALEVAESLEQLRALALGVRIHVTILDASPPPGVDTAEDLARVRRSFRER